MTVKERTQVGIVGAGQVGLLLSHLLALGGIEAHLIENRSRAHCEARQRAGILESATAQLLRESGVGRRLAERPWLDGEHDFHVSGDLLSWREVVIEKNLA